jgi:hypothetical protein
LLEFLIINLKISIIVIIATYQSSSSHHYYLAAISSSDVTMKNGRVKDDPRLNQVGVRILSNK